MFESRCYLEAYITICELLKIGGIMNCVGGRYQLLGELGRGGTSIVYLAVDNVLQCKWTVKEVVLEQSNQSADVLKQALRAEIAILNRCDNPYIPRIVNYFEEGNRAYIVRDYVQGNPLSYIVSKNGAQNIKFVIRIGIELCEILKYLHNLHPAVVYGDMKPSNVMINHDGHVKLIDFGAAQELRTIQRENLMNSSNVTFGTKSFAAPEQFSNLGLVSVQSDIYSLSATLAYALFGRKVNGKIDFSRFCTVDDCNELDFCSTYGVSSVLGASSSRSVSNACETSSMFHDGNYKRVSALDRDGYADDKNNFCRKSNDGFDESLLLNNYVMAKLCSVIARGMCIKPENRYKSCDSMMEDLLNLQELLIKNKYCNKNMKIAESQGCGLHVCESRDCGLHGCKSLDCESSSCELRDSKLSDCESSDCESYSGKSKSDSSVASNLDLEKSNYIELNSLESGVRESSDCESGVRESSSHESGIDNSSFSQFDRKSNRVKKSFVSRREIRARKRRHFAYVLVLALSGLLCFVLSPVSFAVSQRVRNENYDRNIRNCSLALDSENAEMYCERAISDESMPMTPLLQLLKYHCRDFRWDSRERRVFNKLLSKYDSRLRSQSELWSKLSFEIGKAYWFYAFDFTKSENVGNNSLLIDRNDKLKNSSSQDDALENEYVEYVHEALDWFDKASHDVSYQQHELISLYKSVASAYFKIIQNSQVDSKEDSAIGDKNVGNSDKSFSDNEKESNSVKDVYMDSYYRNFCMNLLDFLEVNRNSSNEVVRIGSAEVALDSAQFLEKKLSSEEDSNSIEKLYNLSLDIAKSTKTTSYVTESRKKQLLSVFELFESSKNVNHDVVKGILIKKEDLSSNKYANTGGVIINDDSKDSEKDSEKGDNKASRKAFGKGSKKGK